MFACRGCLKCHVLSCKVECHNTNKVIYKERNIQTKENGCRVQNCKPIEGVHYAFGSK